MRRQRLEARASVWTLDLATLDLAIPICHTRPGTHREPNNVFGGEFCAGANATEAFEGLWGWADANCDLAFPFICEGPGEGHFLSCRA